MDPSKPGVALDNALAISVIPTITDIIEMIALAKVLPLTFFIVSARAIKPAQRRSNAIAIGTSAKILLMLILFFNFESFFIIAFIANTITTIDANAFTRSVTVKAFIAIANTTKPATTKSIAIAIGSNASIVNTALGPIFNLATVFIIAINARIITVIDATALTISAGFNILKANANTINPATTRSIARAIGNKATRAPIVLPLTFILLTIFIKPDKANTITVIPTIALTMSLVFNAFIAKAMTRKPAIIASIAKAREIIVKASAILNDTLNLLNDFINTEIIVMITPKPIKPFANVPILNAPSFATTLAKEPRATANEPTIFRTLSA